MTRNANIKRTLIVCTFVCAAVAKSSVGSPISDFDDGTLQGWRPIATPWTGDPFGGILGLAPTGGNTGGFISGIDTSAIGGMLVAGPAEFSGDLSMYTEVRWDEFIYDNPQTVQGTSVFLLGANGTAYRKIQPLDQIGTWATRSVPLQASSWSLIPESGTASFSDVLSDATLAVEFSTSITTFPTLESGIDNITLVPEPSTLVIFVLMILSRPERARCR